MIYQFCRQSPHGAIVMPSHGKYVGAASTPFAEYKPRKGDKTGLHWPIPAMSGRRAVRYALIDTNYWKSFVHARLAVPMGDPGCLSLFAAADHRLVAEHLTSEYRIKTQGRGREVEEWKLRTPGTDNHWLDCLVGSAVVASMQGVILFGTDVKRRPRRRIKLSELQKEKHAARARALPGRPVPHTWQAKTWQNHLYSQLMETWQTAMGSSTFGRSSQINGSPPGVLEEKLNSVPRSAAGTSGESS